MAHSVEYKTQLHSFYHIFPVYNELVLWTFSSSSVRCSSTHTRSC